MRIDPRNRNRAGGFSPGQQISARIPDLDSQRAFERSGIAPITDVEQSLARRQPVVLIDARTGPRQPFWAEVDSSAPSHAQRALFIRPARTLVAGRRYVVAPRRLRTASGGRIAPKFAFHALRDRRPTRSRAIEQRRPAMRRVFRALRHAGIGLRSHPAFAGAFDASGRLFYDGNSQGGIEGGALTALAPDFDRAVLGVPGMNYSTLLQRSVDFAPFRSLLEASYTKRRRP